MNTKNICVMIVVFSVLIAGCSSPRPILGCEYFGSNDSENIDEIRDKMNRSPHTGLTNYSELTEDNKRIFTKALRDETDINEDIDRAWYYNNTTFLNQTEMSGFISVNNATGTRYIIYENSIYKCNSIGTRGVA
ncbi:MAG: hypothetical protein U5J64_07820 [Halobacteriales archaeon]|nr:hypothetical protein [Halobacteriales archaeon]